MYQKGITNINIILVIIIVILLGVMSYLVLIRKPEIPFPPGFRQQTQLASLESIIENKFPKWIAMWKEIIPGFDISTFKKIREESGTKTEYPYDPTAKENKLREFLYIYSPDKTKFIDPYAYMYLYEEDRKIKPAFEPDSAVALVDVESKKRKQVLFCGTPCGFDDAVWIDNNTFVVVGHSEYYPESGEERCTVNTKCTYVATLHVIDLLKDTVTLYYGPESEKRVTAYPSYLQDKFPNIDFD